MAELDALLQRLFWTCMMPVVGLYAVCTALGRHIGILRGKLFAYLMDVGMRKMAHRMRPRKLKLFCELHDIAAAKDLMNKDQGFQIVEIGAGSGVNFEYYPKGAKVTCVDPNPHYEKYLKRNARQFPDLQLEALHCGAEDMGRIHDNSVDAVVGTLVLCSVKDVSSCLREIKRILKPGGKYFYLEHVAAEKGSFTYKVQKFLQGIFLKLADCNMCQETKRCIEATSFSQLDHEQFWTPEAPSFLFLFKTMLIGKAKK